MTYREFSSQIRQLHCFNMNTKANIFTVLVCKVFSQICLLRGGGYSINYTLTRSLCFTKSLRSYIRFPHCNIDLLNFVHLGIFD